MRSPIVSRHVRRLSQAGIVIALTLSATACSSDFTRFDRDLRAALPQGASQQQAANPYPGDVDPTTTASISGQPMDRMGRPLFAPNPAVDVVTPVVQPDHAAGTVSQADDFNTPRVLTPSSDPSGIERRSLPAPTGSQVRNRPAQAATDPDTRASNSVPAPVAETQPVATNDQVVAAESGAGWSRAGGTAVTVRSGETLYNLSKRYGVPVREIMRANGISNAHSVQAGQQIVVPTYVYSQSAPVSAPDADPKTAASRSTTGMIGEARGAVGLPAERPERMAASVPPEVDARNAPDQSVVTGSVGRAVSMDGVYTVQSGDTLSGIASRNGTSVQALMDANGLTSADLKIGQGLRIPTVSPGDAQTVLQPTVSQQQVLQQQVQPVQPKPAEPQPVQQANVEQPKAYTKPTVDQTVTNAVDVKAPERTGIAKLRWPVNGRVISGFGDSRRNGTNDGIDISVPEGTPVRAAENGVVVYSGEIEGFGNLILLRHGDGLVTAYAHNKQNNVSKGASVNRGEVIALSGRTGDATAPMLHFEVRKDTKPVNPEKYLGG